MRRTRKGGVGESKRERDRKAEKGGGDLTVRQMERDRVMATSTTSDVMRHNLGV